MTPEERGMIEQILDQAEGVLREMALDEFKGDTEIDVKSMTFGMLFASLWILRKISGKDVKEVDTIELLELVKRRLKGVLFTL